VLKQITSLWRVDLAEPEADNNNLEKGQK